MAQETYNFSGIFQHFIHQIELSMFYSGLSTTRQTVGYAIIKTELNKTYFWTNNKWKEEKKPHFAKPTLYKTKAAASNFIRKRSFCASVALVQNKHGWQVLEKF